MAARFNKHIPLLCEDCGKPLCVREKRLSGKVCAWDEYLRLRADFALQTDGDMFGFWAEAEVSETAEAPTETYWISEGALFGVVTEGFEPTTPAVSGPRSTD